MIDMKAKIHDSGSIKTVLVQDDNGDKFITGLEELLDMLVVFFNVKDINGEPVPHFMLPTITGDNAYLVEGKDDTPESLVKIALGDYKLTTGEMEYMGWKGDTPPILTREEVNSMVKKDDWVPSTIKVPRKLIVRD